MAEKPFKPVLQKPPGYKDPNAPAKPVPRPAPLKTVLPASFRPKKERRNCCRTCCCWFIILIFVLLLIFAILAALFYLWFDPKLPTFHLQSFKFTTFDVRTTPEGTYLNAVTVARVEVRNPNSKLTYRYGQSKVELTTGDGGKTELGSVSLAGFSQGKKNTTSLKIETKVKNELLDEDALGSRILREFKSKNFVVNLKVKTSVGLGVGGMEIGMLGVNILCGDMKLKQLESGAMPECTINLLKCTIFLTLKGKRASGKKKWKIKGIFCCGGGAANWVLGFLMDPDRLRNLALKGRKRKKQGSK